MKVCTKCKTLTPFPDGFFHDRSTCNPGLGFFQHDVELLEKARHYLIRIAGWRP